MKKTSKPKTVARKKTRDASTAIRFAEELSWLLSTYSNLDFKVLPEMLGQSSEFKEKANALGGYVSNNPNIHFLVGALPGLLNDENIFSSNEEIASFAHQVLGVNVLRWQKKSKYEIIGHIVCNTYNLDDRKFNKLVEALSRLFSQGDYKNRIAEHKKKAGGMSWNELIQNLSV